MIDRNYSIGNLSEEKQKELNELAGREITLKEIRLIPYIHYCAINSSMPSKRKCTDEELDIYDFLLNEKHVIKTKSNTIIFSAKYRQIVYFVLQWAYEGL